MDDVTDTCKAPLSFSAVIGLVIAFCVLGLIWAFINMVSVNKIDVEKGIDGESDSLVGDISEEQKQLLIELGEKISNVKIINKVGCNGILETIVFDLPYIRIYHVLCHMVFDLGTTVYCICIRHWSINFNMLWSYWYDYCH